MLGTNNLVMNCANFGLTNSEQAIARTANKGFAIAGVPCFADTFVQGESSVLRMKFSAKTPRHRKPPKRYPTEMINSLKVLFSSRPKVKKRIWVGFLIPLQVNLHTIFLLSTSMETTKL